MNGQGVGAVVTLFCLLPLFFVSLPALFVVLEAMSPHFLEGARACLARRPGRSFLVGLLNGVFFFFLAAILGSSGVGLLALIGVSLLLALLLLAVVGFGALAGRVGGRVFELGERPAPPVARLLVGSVILEALFFIPVVGWLTLTILGLSGFGAVLLALRRRRTVQAMVETTA